MLNSIHFLLICHVIILKVTHAVDTDSSEKVTLTVTHDNNPPIVVNLMKTESFLANENLPIWVGRGTLLEILDSEKIMRELGPFTTYQDVDSTSAAVYFHKRHEFDGMIDYRYYIKNLPFNDRQKVIRVNKDGPIIERPITGHFFGNKSEKNLTQSLHQLRGKSDEQITELPKLNITMHSYRPNIVYIETLILINHDMVEHLQPMFHNEYNLVISYLLTLFNGVDMLYSKVRNPRIKFNIAGIIIGLDRESFFDVIKCYRQKNLKNLKTHLKGPLDYMDAYCTVNATNDYLTTVWRLVPRDSYDIAIFLTRYGLFVDEYNSKSERIQFVKLGGSARRYPASGYQKYRVDGSMYVPSTSITDLGNFSSFPVIVHETAHLFGVKHDELLRNGSETFPGNIMKATVGYCKTCLSWSDASRNYMQTFFSSPDRCTFMNRPRSLQKPGPRKIWTVDQQCQCYGHDPSRKSLRKNKSGVWMGPNLSCITNLHCKVRGGTSVMAPIPMDGTPCGRNKVCWNKECSEDEHTIQKNARLYKHKIWEPYFSI